MLENPQAIKDAPHSMDSRLLLVKMAPLVVPLLVSQAVRTQLL